jgi:SPP1 family phage portal protein
MNVVPVEKELVEQVWGINYDYRLAKLSVSKLGNTGKPQEAFLLSSIGEFEDSRFFKQLKVAEKYLVNENEEIMKVQRNLIDLNGNTISSPFMSNTKLSHPFFYTLIEQKVNYLLGSELSVRTDERKYGERLSEYISKGFIRKLKTVGTNAVAYGLSWLQVYYNESGELKFRRIPSDEIIPFWADSDHSELEAVIHYYKVENIDEEGKKSEITKIKYYTDEGVWHYMLAGGQLVLDDQININPSSHFSLEFKPDTEDDGKTVSASWNRIPFICFRYNQMEISLLQWVKSLIDDYDRIASDASNNIKDFPDSFKVVKGYNPEETDEFNRMLAVHRTAFLDADPHADMQVLTMEMNMQGVKTILDRLRKDIFDAGKGIDPQETNFGHASGVAIRYRYEGLARDCSAMGNQFQDALNYLLYFVDFDILLKYGENYFDERVDFIFNTEAIMNETEVIANLRNSYGIISEKTIIAHHPYVTDTEAELEQLKAERREYGLQVDSLDPVPNSYGSDELLEAETKQKGLDIQQRG